MEIQYSLREDGVIEKRGEVYTFTLDQLDASQLQLFKLQKELNAQIMVEDAKIANVEEHHPFVKEMSEFDISTARVYYEATALKKACASKLLEVNEAIDGQMSDRIEIMKQLPQLAEVKTPVVPEVPVAEENAPSELVAPVIPK